MNISIVILFFSFILQNNSSSSEFTTTCNLELAINKEDKGAFYEVSRAFSTLINKTAFDETKGYAIDMIFLIKMADDKYNLQKLILYDKRNSILDKEQLTAQ